MKKTNKKKGYIFHGPDFSVMIKYSKTAEEGKIIKFIPKKGKPFELSTKDFTALLAKHVNFEVLAPSFIHNKQVNLIRVTRNVTFTPNRDIKAGETVHIPFQHMIPIEFAITEEALGVALIDEKVKTVNERELKAAKERVDAAMEEYSAEQYKAFLAKQNNPNSS